MDATEVRSDGLRGLSRLFDVEITRVRERVGGSGKVYYVTAGGNEIRVGNLAALMTRTKFENALLVATRGRLRPTASAAEWTTARQYLGMALELAPGPDPSEGRGLVAKYLEAHPPASDEMWVAAARLKAPFVRRGRVHLNLPALEAFAGGVWHREPLAGEVATLLREAGWEPYSINLPAGEGRARTQLRVWREA